MTEVAERYGVSRQRVHTWLLFYRQEKIAALEEHSHRVREYILPAKAAGVAGV